MSQPKGTVSRLLEITVYVVKFHNEFLRTARSIVFEEFSDTILSNCRIELKFGIVNPHLNRVLPKSTLCMNSGWFDTSEVSHKKAHIDL